MTLTAQSDDRRTGLRGALPPPAVFVKSIANADYEAARALVDRMRSEGAPVEVVITSVLAPALVEVGERWASGRGDAAEAWAATSIVRSVLPRSSPRCPNEGRPAVSVLCPPGEQHELPAELLSELLRSAGWPVQLLGAGLPAEYLSLYLSGQRPSALLLSCTTACAFPGAAKAIEVAHRLDVPAVVGGLALGTNDRLAARLGAAAWAPTATDAIMVLEGWRNRIPSLPRPHPRNEQYQAFQAIRGEIAERVGGATGGPPGDGGAPAMGSRDRLELLLQNLAAALLVDDGALFYDFVSRQSTRDQGSLVHLTRLTEGLSQLGAALPTSATTARAFVGEALQGVVCFESEHRSRPEGRACLAVAPGAAAPDGDLARDPTAPAMPFTNLLFAAKLCCHAPLAVVAAAEPEGQWTTFSYGVGLGDFGMGHDFFREVGQGREPLEISDLLRHPRFAASNLTRGALALRYGYGIPLRDGHQSLLGILCVFDRHTRELSPRERRAFAAIACKIAERLASDHPAGGSRRTAADRDEAVKRAVARHGTAPGAKENVQLPFLMRTSEVASLFGVTTRTALNWATTGRIPSIRTAGNQVRFPSDGVLALLGTGPFHGSAAKKSDAPR